MNRIERISAILIQLQSKKYVKAQDIADRFDISLRTVYRDIKALEATGVPIIGESGIGYSLVDGYKLPPIQFTLPEATAFITAEKLIDKLTDSSMSKDYKSALYKVKSVLKNNDKHYIETIDNNIAVLSNPYLPNKTDKIDFLQVIIEAIASKSVLQMKYWANHNQETSERAIEPVGVYFQTGKWYLIAYCTLRNDYRQFRLDRVQSLINAHKNFEQEHPTLKDYLKRITQEEKLYTVVLKFDNESLKYLGEQKYYNGYVSEKKGKEHTEMTFITSTLEGIMRWYMMVADRAEIVSPKELKTKAKAYIQLIQKKN